MSSRFSHAIDPFKILNALLTWACLGAACLWLTTQTVQAADEGVVREYQIPAGPLTSALNHFAAEAGIFLSGNGDLTQGKSTQGLNGTYSVSQGLSILLSGTGLQAIQSSDGTYALQVLPQSSNEAVLPTMKVEGQAGSAVAPSMTSQLNYLKNKTTTGALGSSTILDTPFSITTVDNQEIVERGARSIGQIFVNDASVYTPTSSFTTDWWGTKIRGLDTQTHFIDGIPMLLHWGGDFPIEAVESVTALKGLNGFMYGFGSPGGALSYQLKRPTDVPLLTMNFGYRDPSMFSAHIDTSRNYGEGWGVRLNLAMDQGTAYNDSETDRLLVSAAIDKDFGESLTWFTTLMYEDNITEAQPFQFYTGLYDVAGSGGKLPDVTYDYDDFNIDNSYYKTKTQLVSTGLDWDINENWNLRYQLGFSRKHHESNRSFAYLLNREGDYSGNHYNFAYETDGLFSQLIAQGFFKTGTIGHQLVTGLDFQEERTKGANEYYWSNDFNGNIYQNQTYLFTRTPDFSLQDPTKVKQLAVFVSDTLAFNQHWEAIVGLRGTDYEMIDSDYDTQEVSPTLALIYKPNIQTSIYGSYVEGLEPGEVVSGSYNNQGEVLGATVSKQYEAGIKHASDTYSYTAALFRIERANLMNVLKPGNALPDRTQDGLSVYDGVEFSGANQFTSNLNLGVSLIYLDAAIDKTQTAAIKGNTPAGVSDWQSVIFGEYRIPAMQALSVHGNVRYYGESYTSNENNMKMPGWTIVNAGFSYEFDAADQGMVLYGNIYNLFNEKYWAAGGGQTNAGEARNFSLMLSTSF